MHKYDTVLSTAKKFHFVGIGGSGMCPIAEILHSQGYIITGSDINEGDTLDRIKSYGIPVYMNHKAENIGDAEVLVYTAAVKEDNPELMAARKNGIVTIERSIMLGIVARRYKNTIAVSGTHGKTTVTSMLTQVLIGGGADPTAVIGGKLPLIGGNAKIGKSETFVCEACEYVDTFLQLTPNISVILNVDADHLDYFGTLERIIESFHQFSTQTDRAVFVNGDDVNAMKAVEEISADVITFGFDKSNKYYAENVKISSMPSFDLMKNGKKLVEVSLSVPGKHNVYNALAACAVCDYMGIKAEDIAIGLYAFTGANRRFQHIATHNDITIIDDFAHHPTELTATLTAAKSMDFKRVWAVFQPHTYSRTYHLLNQFAKALSIADKVVMTEILAVRETNSYGIHTADLAEKIPKSVWFDSFEKIADYIFENAKPGDAVITLGGGDVYKLARIISGKYEASNIQNV